MNKDGLDSASNSAVAEEHGGKLDNGPCAPFTIAAVLALPHVATSAQMVATVPCLYMMHSKMRK